METTHTYNRFAIERAEQDSFFSSVLSSSMWLLKCSNGKAFPGKQHEALPKERGEEPSRKHWLLGCVCYKDPYYSHICEHLFQGCSFSYPTFADSTIQNQYGWHGDAVVGKGTLYLQ